MVWAHYEAIGQKFRVDARSSAPRGDTSCFSGCSVS